MSTRYSMPLILGIRQCTSEEELDEVGWTVVHRAVHLANCRFVELLLEMGLDGEASDTKGYTPLHLCAELGDVKMTELLISHGAALETQDNKGRTPLHISIEKRNTALMELLIAKGASFYTKDNRGRSVITYIINSYSVAGIKMLLGAGVSVDSASVHEIDNMVWGLLHKTAHNGWAEGVKLLLEEGAAIGQLGLRNRTALHEACQHFCNPLIVQLLLDNGADINEGQNRGFCTPLHNTAIFDTVEAAEILVREGANRMALNGETLTPRELFDSFRKRWMSNPKMRRLRELLIPNSSPSSF